LLIDRLFELPKFPPQVAVRFTQYRRENFKEGVARLPMNSSSSLPSVVRLEPVCRYLFRRVIVVPALAGLSLFAALPAHAQTAGEPPAKTDSGSLGPIVSIVKPEYSDVLKDVVQIVVAVEPRRYPAQSVELLVDGKAVSGILPIQSKFNWKTNLFKDGQHTLTVRVTDTQGFIGQAETRIFIGNSVAKTPDTLAPVLNWLNLKNGQEVSGPVTVRLNAKDDFGVKYVFLRLNSAIMPDEKGSLASWMTNRPPYEFTLDTGKFDDGDYIFDAYAWDAQNNEENAPRLSVKFRNHGMNPTTIAPPKYLPPKVNPQTINPPVESNGGDDARPATTGSNAIKTPKNFGGDSQPNFPPQGVKPGDVIISDRQSPRQTPKPSTPAIASFIVPPRQGAVQNVASPASRDADITRESRQGTSEQVSRPELGERVNASIKPPVIAVNPPVDNSTPNSVTPKATPAPPRFVERTPVEPKDATTAAWTALSSPATLAPSTPAQARTSASGARVERSETFSITSPLNLPRLARRDPGAAQPNDKALPAITVAGESFSTNFTDGSASVAHRDSGLTRIASVLPGEISTPPAKDVWYPQHRSGQGASTRAQATTVESSPADNVTVGPGASPDNEKNPRGAALTTPPALRIVEKPTVVKPAMIKTPIQGAKTPNSKPISEVPSLPTQPRISMSPDIKNGVVPHHYNAAIVVAPVEALQSKSVIATRDESLAAFARRIQTPLAMVAAANKITPEAKVQKGQSLIVPQPLTVTYQGQPVTGDVAPLLIGSTSVAPFRFMFEQQGGKLLWDAQKQQVTARNDEYEVTITVGSDKALVNQKEELMDMAAFLLSGRTMVPVRFFESALHATVAWEPSTGRLYVASLP
jgi:hypothetical protein